MNRFLKFFSIALAALVLSGYVIKETKLNEDLAFWINDGGTPKKALNITGSTGAVTIGASGETATHTVNGGLLLGNGSTAMSSNTTTGNTNVLQIETYGSSGNGYPNLNLISGRGTRASPTQTQSGDVLGEIVWRGITNAPAQSGGVAIIRAAATQSFTASLGGTALSLYTTTNGNASGTLRHTFEAAGGQTAAVPDGQSLTIDRAYTNASAANDALVVQRAGGAVRAAIGYDDGNTRMYMGTRTAHSLAITTGASGNVSILLDASQNVRFPAYGRGVVQADASGNLTSSNTFVTGAMLQGSDCTSGPCNWTATYGGGITSSFTRNGTGDYVVNFTPGFWSSTVPACTVSDNRASSRMCVLGNGTLTTQPVFCYTDAGTLVDSRPSIMCVGSR